MTRIRAALAASGAVWLAAVVTMAASAQAPSGSEGWSIPKEAASTSSSVPPGPAALAKGKTLFQFKCARCHGPDGAGRGPDADGGHPPPDLRDPGRALLNPDGVMFYKIWNGRAKPRMPAMKSELTTDEVWMIVQYLKAMRQKS